MPQHNHPVNTDNKQNNANTTNTPANNTVLGQSVGSSSTGSPINVSIYGASGNNSALYSQTVGNNGGSQAHNNLMPYLCLNMCMALQGIFPSQN
jgi:microcystin-dependent protein